MIDYIIKTPTTIMASTVFLTKNLAGHPVRDDPRPASPLLLGFLDGLRKFQQYGWLTGVAPVGVSARTCEARPTAPIVVEIFSINKNANNTYDKKNNKRNAKGIKLNSKW